MRETAGGKVEREQRASELATSCHTPRRGRSAPRTDSGARSALLACLRHRPDGNPRRRSPDLGRFPGALPTHRMLPPIPLFLCACILEMLRNLCNLVLFCGSPESRGLLFKKIRGIYFKWYLLFYFPPFGSVWYLGRLISCCVGIWIVGGSASGWRRAWRHLMFLLFAASVIGFRWGGIGADAFDFSQLLWSFSCSWCYWTATSLDSVCLLSWAWWTAMQKLSFGVCNGSCSLSLIFSLAWFW